jgi:hypothetical protein
VRLIPYQVKIIHNFLQSFPIHDNRTMPDMEHIFELQIPLAGPHSIIGRAVVVHADPDDLGKGNSSEHLDRAFNFIGLIFARSV